MKYLLIEETDDNNNTVVVYVFETEQQRIRQTLQITFGNPEEDSQEAKDSIELLKEQRYLSFEGDPGIQWLNAVAIYINNKFLGHV